MQVHRRWLQPTFRRAQFSFQQRFYSEVSVERLSGADDGIVIVSLNRPKAKNALGKNLLTEFGQVISELRFDKQARVVILNSSVPRVFCAGADLKERATMAESEVAQFVHQLRTTFTDWEKLGQPTIAAIDGAALGGGLELALACDLRIAGGDAIIGLPETGLAIIPGAGGTQRLPRLIGIPKAKELIFTCRRLNSKQAHEFGIVSNFCEDGSSLPQALDLAREILPNGPIALRMAKLAIDGGIDAGSKASGMNVEQLCYAQVIPTKDRIEGITAFREKRKPIYCGE